MLKQVRHTFTISWYLHKDGNLPSPYLMTDIASCLQYSYHSSEMKPQDPSDSRSLRPIDLPWIIFVISNLERSPPNLVAPSFACTGYMMFGTFNLRFAFLTCKMRIILDQQWVCNKIMYVKILWKYIQ